MMKLRALIAAAALLTVPAAALADDPAQQGGSDYSTKKTCRVDLPLGSRLGGVKRCRTKAERDQHRRDSREVMEKVQIGGNARCRPPLLGGGCS